MLPPSCTCYLHRELSLTSPSTMHQSLYQCFTFNVSSLPHQSIYLFSIYLSLQNCSFRSVQSSDKPFSIIQPNPFLSYKAHSIDKCIIPFANATSTSKTLLYTSESLSTAICIVSDPTRRFHFHLNSTIGTIELVFHRECHY